MSKYVCIVEGCSLAFMTKDHCTIRIDKHEIVEMVLEGGKQDLAFGENIRTVTLFCKGKFFLCFETDLKEYFISLAEMRDQQLEEILN